jgi:hypothetical protein
LASTNSGTSFVAAHKGVYWVQYLVNSGSGQYIFPYFQAKLNGVGIPGSQCVPVLFQGETTTAFITAANAGDNLAIQCNTNATASPILLTTFSGGYFASLTIIRLK